MKIKITQLAIKSLLLCLLSFTFSSSLKAQQRVKKVVVQAFWWDNWNNNFRFKWADYLTELAPRLKALGVDAIWVPPNYKNDGPGSVGYGPFDQYDLGDKFQKGETASDTVRTRSGNKDELLRMIAVMHANGIEVIQDIVLNHQSGAGNRGGGGGRDFTAASAPYQDNATNYFKNFRYVCYSTPHLDTSAADYWTRKGRWSKNIMNFYPNANNNSVNTNAINTAYFGPDMAYESNSIGLSTSIPTSGTVTIKGITKPYFNPTQPSNYMAQGAKDWIVWYKKQTGSDGFRWDAVKHFGYDVQRDLTYALKYQSGFANGGNSMFNVGEYVGTASEVDYYVSQLVRSGTPVESGVTNEQMSGGFDFGLRGYGPGGGIYSMVLGGGGFDMQSIPGAQQSTRYFDYPNGVRVYKTVPFVNSHDTYRPFLTATGNYAQSLGNNAGWNTGQELGGNGQHIDPREPRFAAANAVIAAVDGNPCFFLEDVFDYFSVNKRWTHLPSNVDSLPLRKDVGNIMQCHQKLSFKDGDYGVPTAQSGTSAPFYLSGSSGDHLVIERTGKALIGITDAYSPASNNSADQQVWVTCNTAWTPGTILYDFSGAHGITGTTIQSDRRVLIKTSPCGHNIPNVFGHGYSIWAPYPNGTPTSVQDLFNYIATYDQPRVRTTQQEWEMADDLGDSHCASLGQGGQLPANSTNQRVAGKIMVQSGTNVAYYLKPSIDNTNISISLWDLDGNKLSEASGNSSAASPISGSFSATYTGWVTIKVRNADLTQPAQKVWANVTYTAPTSVDTRSIANSATTRVSIWTSNAGTSDIYDCGNWEEGKIPTNNSVIIIPSFAKIAPVFPNNVSGRIIALTSNTGTYKLVNKVNVATKNSTTTYNKITSTDGAFSNSNLIPSNNYVIKLSKNNDAVKAGGVNSTDVLLVQRDILNTTKLNSAYKKIAADVDGNRIINSVDVLRMKRLILATDTTFTSSTKGNRLWEFVDSAYVFPDTTNPFPFKDSIITNATLNSTNANKTFIGVKLGDVNYDWQASQARGLNLEPIELQYSFGNKQLEANNAMIKIPITANNFKDLVGMQYTLQFNKNDYDLVNIENNKLIVDYNKNQASSKGLISMLWTDAKAEEKSFNRSEELFTLIFKPRTRTLTNDLNLTLTNDLTDVEAWDKDFNQHNIILTKQQKIQTPNTEQWSVSPNPTSGEIKVSIASKTNKTVSFELTDAQGKTILKQSVELQKGTNNFAMNLKQNGNLTTGVYFLKADGIEGENVKRIMVK
ncbi:MAG: alpha-amylase family glycosyl hydrolase [Chitinophagaceae bacterium]